MSGDPLLGRCVDCDEPFWRDGSPDLDRCWSCAARRRWYLGLDEEVP